MVLQLCSLNDVDILLFNFASAVSASFPRPWTDGYGDSIEPQSSLQQQTYYMIELVVTFFPSSYYFIILSLAFKVDVKAYEKNMGFNGSGLSFSFLN